MVARYKLDIVSYPNIVLASNEFVDTDHKFIARQGKFPETLCTFYSTAERAYFCRKLICAAARGIRGFPRTSGFYSDRSINSLLAKATRFILLLFVDSTAKSIINE